MVCSLKLRHCKRGALVWMYTCRGALFTNDLIKEVIIFIHGAGLSGQI